MTPDELHQLADRLDNIADILDAAHHREDLRAAAAELRATASDTGTCPKCLGRKDDGMGARVVEVEGREVLAILKCEACDGTGRATASDNPSDHECDNCNGVDPSSCLANPDRDFPGGTDDMDAIDLIVLIARLAAERDAAVARADTAETDAVRWQGRAVTASAEVARLRAAIEMHRDAEKCCDECAAALTEDADTNDGRLWAAAASTATPDHDGHTIDVGPVTVHDERCPNPECDDGRIRPSGNCGFDDDGGLLDIACPDPWHTRTTP